MIVKTEELKNACKKIAKFLNKSPKVGAYKKLRISASYNDYRGIHLTAFDGQHAFSCGIQEHEPTKAALIDVIVDRNQFLAAVEKLRGETTSVYNAEDKLNVFSEEVTASLPVYPEDQIAELEDLSGLKKVSLPVPAVLAALGMVSALTADNQSVSSFSGVMLHGSCMYATDTYRFTKVCVDNPDGATFDDCLLSLQTAKKLASLRPTTDCILAQSKSAIVLAENGESFVAMKKECKDYPFAVTPQFPNPKIVELPKELAPYVSSARKFSTSVFATVEGRKGELWFRCGGQDSSYDAEFVWDQPDFHFSISMAYLEDALRVGYQVDVSEIESSVVRFIGPNIEHIVALSN